MKVMVEGMVEGGRYRVEMDYKKPLCQMVEAGNFLIEQNFHIEKFEDFPKRPYRKSKFIEAVILHLEIPSTTQEILSAFKRNSLRPATLKELLAFGTQHPEVVALFQIKALGSKRNADPHEESLGWIFPMLDSEDRLILCTRWAWDKMDEEWEGGSENTFLAVRK